MRMQNNGYAYNLDYLKGNREEPFNQDKEQFSFLETENKKYCMIESDYSFRFSTNNINKIDEMEEDTINFLKNESTSRKLCTKLDWGTTYCKLYPKFPKCEKPGQLIGHVDKFNNVLLTDGLVFCFLKKLETDEIKIVRKVDLTPYYNEYKGLSNKQNFKSDMWDNDLVNALDSFLNNLTEERGNNAQE